MSVKLTTIPVLAIDGPSGAGKGTISSLMADKLGWHLLDSGALYRAVAYVAASTDMDLDDVDAIAGCGRELDIRFRPTIPGELTHVLIDGRDVSAALRLEQTGENASRIAQYKPLRQALLDKQRDLRQLPGLVADGRDMGTVVFADAPYKVFLTASAEERAQRRYMQLKAKGVEVKIDSLIEAIKLRDAQDQSRKEAPLVAAKDARVLDTTDMSIQAVVNQLIEWVRA